MIEGISITCFAASYAVTLALEFSRLFLRSGLRGAVMIGFAAAGLFAHTLFLVYRAAAVQGPLSSAFDWYMLAAWVLGATYLYLTLYHLRNAIGVFVLPLVLGLIAVGALAADREPFPVSQAALFWGTVHGALLLMGAVAVMVGFITGIMYLVQAYRLKHKLPMRQGFELPSLEWLERVNGRAILASVMLLGCGIIAGAVLNLVNHGESTDHVPWTDPIIWSSVLAVVWLFAAAVFNAIYRPARQGRKVAYLTVVSFVFLALALAVSLFVDTQHSGTPPGTREGEMSQRTVSGATCSRGVMSPGASNARRAVRRWQSAALVDWGAGGRG